MSLLPDILSKEDSEAVKEVAKTAGITVEAARDFCGYMSSIFGTIPKDLVGLFFGDPLRHIRFLNLNRMNKRKDEILRERGIFDKVEPVSPRIAIPLLEAAQDETREELSELWSRLLANAMDPDRSRVVRLSMISVLKQFDPQDAFVLEKALAFNDGRPVFINTSKLFEFLSLQCMEDDFCVSVSNLCNLDCIRKNTNEEDISKFNIKLTPFGRELLRACSL